MRDGDASRHPFCGYQSTCNDVRARVFISIFLFNSGQIMGIFNWLKGNKTSQNGDSADAPASLPWEGRPSIYEHIKQHIQPGVRGLAEGGYQLPDEDRRSKEGELRWGRGSMDGVLSHHMGEGGDTTRAKMLCDYVKAFCATPTVTNLSTVYNFILEDQMFPLVDGFLALLMEDSQEVDTERLFELGYVLATQGADQEPVKCGLAILGLYHGDGPMEVLQTLGRHDEFTLYSAVGLSNLPEGSDQAIWELAKQVDGWGRIHTVERLKETDDPQIQDWLLHEGYRNSILNEYLAYISAVTGGLRDAITQSEVEDRTLSAAGELIIALTKGGPAPGMDDYDDGAEAVAAYVTHMRERARSLKEFNILAWIRDYVTEEDVDWTARESNGWTKGVRQQVRDICEGVLGDEKWRAMVLADLASGDDKVFNRASSAARELGIDTWSYSLARLEEKPLEPSRWSDVVSYCATYRIDELVSFAKRVLPLDKIATGPDESLGLKPESAAHDCLNYVLQALRKHPGKGVELIKVGLNSPVIPNRNMAVYALSAWGRANWPDELAKALKKAVELEPEDDLKMRMQQVLDGQTLEDF